MIKITVWQIGSGAFPWSEMEVDSEAELQEVVNYWHQAGMVEDCNEMGRIRQVLPWHSVSSISIKRPSDGSDSGYGLPE